MIDVVNGTEEQLLSLSDATRVLPKIQGKRPHNSTVWRWCRIGVKARSGRRVRLEHVRVGARVFTTAAALNAFVADVAAADAEAFDGRSNGRTPANSTPRGRSDAQRRRDVLAAEQTLRAGGVV